jgi:hypothetical protein
MSPAALRLAPTPAARRPRKRRDRLAAGRLLVHVELDSETLDGALRRAALTALWRGEQMFGSPRRPGPGVFLFPIVPRPRAAGASAVLIGGAGG